MINLKSKDKIIIIALQGIGNTLFLIPMVKALKKKYPSVSISILLRKTFIKEVIDNSGFIDNYYILEDFKFSNLFKAFKLLLKLRSLRFKISLTAFPANKHLFNLVSFFIGATHRIAHKYKRFNFRNLNFLNTQLVPLKLQHDYYQNFNLLNPLGISTPNKIRPELWFKNNDEASAFLKSHKITKKTKLIGLHPGSSSQRAMKEKRWSSDKFEGLIQRIVETYPSVKILVFLGPDESDLFEIFKKNKNLIIIFKKELSFVISLIAKVNFFISNDSGLMNIAVALGKKVLAISGGPTDPIRTYPLGTGNSLVFSNIDCYPCRGLHNIGQKFHCIYSTRKCLETISLDLVWDIFKAHFQKVISK